MNKLKTLSGAQLKYIAFTTMLIDHVNKALIYPNLNGGILLVISDIFDILGRIAFPIFIFLLIEGYFRTTNRWKYLDMLLLFRNSFFSFHCFPKGSLPSAFSWGVQYDIRYIIMKRYIFQNFSPMVQCLPSFITPLRKESF